LQSETVLTAAACALHLHAATSGFFFG
jgi:hypothetical protein